MAPSTTRERMEEASPLAPSSGTTRCCGPCSATPCVTSGWLGARAGDCACPRSTAHAARRAHPGGRRAHRHSLAVTWSSGLALGHPGPPLVRGGGPAGRDGSTSRAAGCRYPRRSCGGPAGATSSGRPSRRPANAPRSCRGARRDVAKPPRAGAVERARPRRPGVHRRRGRRCRANRTRRRRVWSRPPRRRPAVPGRAFTTSDG